MGETNKKKIEAISRRKFLTGAGLAASGLAAVSVLGALSACKDSIATTTVTQDQTVTATRTETVSATGQVKTVTLGNTTTTATVYQPVTATTNATAGGSGMSLRDAIKNRKSATSFSSQAIPRDKLVDLLCNAWGINRPESGKRTAPSAVNAQEIDIYVFTGDGVFVYDHKTNDIKQVSAQDMRAKAITMGNYQKATALVYIADYAKFASTWSQSDKERFSAAHSGFIGQSVYLYCAAEGLAARFHASVDRTGLASALNLTATQTVVFGQVVGYP
jgi:hypothetical protein